MNEIVFLVEEPSMKEFLKAILPKVLPDNVVYTIIHQAPNNLMLVNQAIGPILLYLNLYSLVNAQTLYCLVMDKMPLIASSCALQSVCTTIRSNFSPPSTRANFNTPAKVSYFPFSVMYEFYFDEEGHSIEDYLTLNLPALFDGIIFLEFNQNFCRTKQDISNPTKRFRKAF